MKLTTYAAHPCAACYVRQLSDEPKQSDEPNLRGLIRAIPPRPIRCGRQNVRCQEGYLFKEYFVYAKVICYPKFILSAKSFIKQLYDC